jgi:exonuclease SbcC
MIPLQLTLKNFLSYGEATLDFRGLHTACICGANGAGKSSLLEAMTWVLWGKSRASSDDDVIQTGAPSVRVDFMFISGEVTYRVIRSRPRGRSGELQFQVQTHEDNFRPITEKGIRATQEKIIELLKLDYDTFVNSAYLRQGRADEFMLRGASDRKKILADMLKLDQYERLADRAKDTVKALKAQQAALLPRLDPLAARLAQREAIAQQQTDIAAALTGLEQQHSQQQQQLKDLRKQNHERDRWAEQHHWQESRLRDFDADHHRLQQDHQALTQRMQALEALLNNQEAIAANHHQLQQWRDQEATLASKFTADQTARQERQRLERDLSQARNQIQLNIRETQTQLAAVEDQRRDLDPLLNQAETIEQRCQELSACRQRVQALDQLQLQVAPLLKQQNQLQIQLSQAKAEFTAQRQQLQREQVALQHQKAAGAGLRQELLAVGAQLTALDHKRTYQERVRSKTQAQHGRQTGLEAEYQALQRRIAELEQKWQLLQQPGADCPLCDRPLDESDRAHVLEKNQTEQERYREQLWLIQEQLTDCQQLQKRLQAEQAELERELAHYDTLSQQANTLDHRLERFGEIQERLWEIDSELQTLDEILAAGHYAQDIQTELSQLQATLADLNYDEKTHGLARAQERKLQWAEAKANQLKEAQKKQADYDRLIPELRDRLQQHHSAIAALETTSDLAAQIQAIDDRLAVLGYDHQHHQDLRQQIRAHEQWELDHHRLQTAQHDYPPLQAQAAQMAQRLAEQERERHALVQELATLLEQMQTLPNYRPEIERLEQEIHSRQSQLDDLKRQQGKIEQQLEELTQVEQDYEAMQSELKQLKQHIRVYEELGKAFGKNGIQALMIENLLPQLEAETNGILTRLTGNQLHVQFVTQRAGKGSTSRKKKTKMIDTLDILIADAQGTRPYETYSGGESFRINFSIRLALAKLLAQRSGAALQMLIIDEGFGTQDGDGCDRLVAAINAIAPDFACILTVTHMPQFKEAFQHRIEVSKGAEGSILTLAS